MKRMLSMVLLAGRRFAHAVAASRIGVY